MTGRVWGKNPQRLDRCISLALWGILLSNKFGQKLGNESGEHEKHQLDRGGGHAHRLCVKSKHHI